MKKGNKHDVLSDDVVCSERGCHKRIKQNLVDRKPEGAPLFCFNHFQHIIESTKGRMMATAREVRTGKARSRIKGRYEGKLLRPAVDVR